PWADKENLFLCSGRIVKPKQTHRVISMLQAVREKGFDVKLHITGGGGGIYADSYMRQIETLARQNSDWVYLHRNLSYKDYLELVSRCRYGVHYKPEPFGISVAEMLKADMIPFVRTFGGQMEIVGSEQKSILFADEQDGVEKLFRF
ncbi:MAG: glycosyltransferase, partial [Cyanobacteria bacterium J06628_6]